MPETGFEKSAETRPARDSRLAAIEGISHGFFTRAGGVSKGIYEGLNVGIGSNDNADHVRENRVRIASNFGVDHDCLIAPFQIHSPDVWTVTAEDRLTNRPKADAVVTRDPGIAIGVVTADCGPVLFADPDGAIVGAAHAGWKGATGGVLENTIDAMERLGASRDRIIAVLGPTISQANYEVGPEFVERLTELAKGNDRYLTPSRKAGHAMFDLPGYIVDRLVSAGVTAGWTGHCTYANEEDFYSYRRKTHRNEPDYGRQISAIAITP